MHTTALGYSVAYEEMTCQLKFIWTLTKKVTALVSVEMYMNNGIKAVK